VKEQAFCSKALKRQATPKVLSGATALRRPAMNRDDLIKAYRDNGASWPALVGLYGLLIGGMILSAQAIL
jgi:hypothetical protein